MRTVRLFECDFAAATQSEVVEWCVDLVRSGERGHVSTVNVNTLMKMRSSADLRRFVSASKLVTADGQPIVWASRLLGGRLPERVAGVDLLEALAERAERDGLGVYLLGGTSELVSATARKLIERFPKVKICGTADGFFTDADAPERALAISKSGAAFLFVGMGTPRQERFLEEYGSVLGVPLTMGVGGSFEVVAGLRRRAPSWLQVTGLEWAYRLLQEPRRLFARYLVTNLQFMYVLARELARQLRSGGLRRSIDR